MLPTGRRRVLPVIGLALAATGLELAASETTTAQTAASAPPPPPGATSLATLTGRLAKAPRRRDFKAVPRILTSPEQWDHEALSELLAYAAGPKQAWDNTDIAGRWLNLMANAMDAQVLSFRHADFLAVSATHATAQLALHDDYVWEKYQFAKVTNGRFKTNTLGAPAAPAAEDITIPSLMRRGAVFLACHIALWERAGALIAAGTNPDGLSREALAAELTNHLIPGVVLTPGAVGTLPELQDAGFRYIA